MSTLCSRRVRDPSFFFSPRPVLCSKTKPSTAGPTTLSSTSASWLRVRSLPFAASSSVPTNPFALLSGFVPRYFPPRSFVSSVHPKFVGNGYPYVIEFWFILEKFHCGGDMSDGFRFFARSRTGTDSAREASSLASKYGSTSRTSRSKIMWMWIGNRTPAVGKEKKTTKQKLGKWLKAARRGISVQFLCLAWHWRCTVSFKCCLMVYKN